MGCFLACFGSSTHPKNIKKEKEAPLQHLQNKYEPVLRLPPSVSPEEEEEEEEERLAKNLIFHTSIPYISPPLPRSQKQDHQNRVKDPTKESEKQEEEKQKEEIKNENWVEWSELIENPKTSITLVESKGKIRGDRRSWCLSAVMSPVENITQWNAIKSKEEEEEEEGEEERHGCDSIVSTSLSTWLSSPNEGNTTTTTTTPVSKYNGVEDRPILGALTLDEIRQFSSANSTPMLTASPHGRGEIPVLGSMGVYCSSNCDGASSFKGMPNTTSKYREDQEVKWHTTPFEMRLERALRTGFA